MTASGRERTWLLGAESGLSLHVRTPRYQIVQADARSNSRCRTRSHLQEGREAVVRCVSRERRLWAVYRPFAAKVSNGRNARVGDIARLDSFLQSCRSGERNDRSRALPRRSHRRWHDPSTGGAAKSSEITLRHAVWQAHGSSLRTGDPCIRLKAASARRV
jgi:hypothetical protein